MIKDLTSMTCEARLKDFICTAQRKSDKKQIRKPCLSTRGGIVKDQEELFKVAKDYIKMSNSFEIEGN